MTYFNLIENGDYSNAQRYVVKYDNSNRKIKSPRKRG